MNFHYTRWAATVTDLLLLALPIPVHTIHLPTGHTFAWGFSLGTRALSVHNGCQVTSAGELTSFSSAQKQPSLWLTKLGNKFLAPGEGIFWGVFCTNPRVVSPVVCSCNWLANAPCIAFLPSLSHSSHEPLLPGITSQINFMHSYPFLSDAF